MIAIQTGNASSRIDIVFDGYKDISIKQQSVRVEEKRLAKAMVILLLARRYNSGRDGWIQQ